ncbi:MAG: hypothetical protein K2Q10_07790, partial [Rhodospirillales bacterium]|nr:hypothetical protein [Rhodospirillales bacterium]
LRSKVDGSALNGHTIGLTVGRFHFETLANVLSGPARDGSTCLWLAKVDATLSIAEHTVYVAREYNLDSCEYNTIMDHENEHIRVNLAIFQEYAPRLDRELKVAVSRLNPIVAQRANASYATNMLNRAIKPILDEMERERAKRQAVLDTPENYRRTQAMCKRW